jgi:23S rRNA-/tRNA-specific pseudouridylate synthase
VHRLDKETSGLLLVAKTRKALVALQDDLRSRAPERAFGRRTQRSSPGRGRRRRR